MQTYVVDLKIRIVVKADNPGMAASTVASAFRRHMDKAEPGYLLSSTLEAHAFEMIDTKRR